MMTRAKLSLVPVEIKNVIQWSSNINHFYENACLITGLRQYNRIIVARQSCNWEGYKTSHDWLMTCFRSHCIFCLRFFYFCNFLLSEVCFCSNIWQNVASYFFDFPIMDKLEFMNEVPKYTVQ